MHKIITALLFSLLATYSASAQDPYLQKHVGIGLSYAGETSKSNKLLYNKMMIDVSTRNDLGSFFGLYSENSIGGAFTNSSKAFFGHQSQKNITPSLSSNTGAGLRMETRFGLSYILGLDRINLPNLKIRWFFGPSLALLESREDLLVRAVSGQSIHNQMVKGGETTIWTIGWHFGAGFDYHSKNKKFAFGSSLFFDAGDRISTFRNHTESNKNFINGTRNKKAYAGGEFSLFSRYKITTRTYLQFSYDLDMANTGLPLSIRRHKIGLAILLCR